MAIKDSDLDEMMGDDFLNGLEEEYINEVEKFECNRPDWVSNNEKNTTFKAWRAILELKFDKENDIKNFGKIATNKTPKSTYNFTQSEVAKKVGVTSQSLFHASSFSVAVLKCFNDANRELVELWKYEQKKQAIRCKRNTGIRLRKKDDIRKSHQRLEVELKSLKEKTVKDVLDSALERMPLDLKIKLGF